jgi:histidinol phosphatase-like enzyme
MMRFIVLLFDSNDNMLNTKLKISVKKSIFIGDTFHNLKASKNIKTNFILSKYEYNNKKINFKKLMNIISDLKKYLYL